jgi:hypothetical protein
VNEKEKRGNAKMGKEYWSSGEGVVGEERERGRAQTQMAVATET